MKIKPVRLITISSIPFTKSIDLIRILEGLTFGRPKITDVIVGCISHGVGRLPARQEVVGRGFRKFAAKF